MITLARPGCHVVVYTHDFTGRTIVVAMSEADTVARSAEIPAELLLTGDFDHLEYGATLTARELRLATSLMVERYIRHTKGRVVPLTRLHAEPSALAQCRLTRKWQRA